MRQDCLEGSLVKTGGLLFEVDPRPFLAVLDQAGAQLKVSNAGLTQTASAEAEIDRAEAAQLKTELDVNRYTPRRNRQNGEATGTRRLRPIKPRQPRFGRIGKKRPFQSGGNRGGGTNRSCAIPCK